MHIAALCTLLSSWVYASAVAGDTAVILVVHPLAVVLYAHSCHCSTVCTAVCPLPWVHMPLCLGISPSA